MAATTWADLTAQFTLLLQDQGATAGTPSYPEPLRMLAWNRAVQYFAVTHTALLKTVKPSLVIDGDGLTVVKPDDWLQVAGIRIENTPILEAIVLPMPTDHTSASQGYWLRSSLFIPGDIPDTTGFSDLGTSLYFADKTVKNAVVWYYAFYPTVVTSTDPLSIPFWAEWAVVNLAISYMLIPFAVGVADLRRWETKRDAGQPEDNPSRIQANWHQKIYFDAVTHHPGQIREIAYR